MAPPVITGQQSADLRAEGSQGEDKFNILTFILFSFEVSLLQTEDFMKESSKRISKPKFCILLVLPLKLGVKQESPFCGDMRHPVDTDKVS